jgi:hypothetical protein
MSKPTILAAIELGPALCWTIPSFFRLQCLNELRSRSARADPPYSTKPIPLRAKATLPVLTKR